MPENAQQKTEMVQQPKLLDVMAVQYKLDGAAFKNVLLKTVFPQDKPVTVEQLASFCAVAQQYKLNPLVREIYAFPAKGGGIIPIVSVDGWITLVQRQPNYNGHKFSYEWEDGKVGGNLLAATCQIFRKDLQNPIEHTEFMVECVRETEPWRKWPRRMCTHKSFIQCARYAFGLSGIYDEDEAQRILEAEAVASRMPEISMPQRVQALPEAEEAQPEGQSAPPQPPSVGLALASPEVIGPTAGGPPQVVTDLFDAGLIKPASALEAKRPIGKGRAQRFYAILNKNKVHTEEEFRKEFLAPLHLEHTSDFPADLYERICSWAEGKLDLEQ